LLKVHILRIMTPFHNTKPDLQDIRRKAARLVAAKCTLAARVDSFHESTDGVVGDNLLAEIEQKLDKMTEPPPVKMVKALPAPIDSARKKRGGRRLVLCIMNNVS